MITFVLCLIILLCGILFYSRFAESVMKPDDRLTPAISKRDGVDFVVMPKWKIFLIQLLNIAGLGPIYGALQGALWGPVVVIWIVLGTVLIGGVHDYFVGMLSERSGGLAISDVCGRHFGENMRKISRVAIFLICLLIGVVFTTGPASLISVLLKSLGFTGPFISQKFWIFIIFVYNFISLFASIDKIIGTIYPFFGILLILMAFGVIIGVIINPDYVMPELFENLKNMHPQQLPIWSFMSVTIACGAISGYHSTQCPIMARCIEKEKDGRIVFYGAMVAEGLLALIWATAGLSVYKPVDGLSINLQNALSNGQAAAIYDVSIKTMGSVGSVIAMLGVIICSITSGDTAFRSARMVFADSIGLSQKDMRLRFVISIPIMIVAIYLCSIDFSIIWRYFTWCNQVLATLVLWTISVYLLRRQKNFWITLLPATFMSAAIITYFFNAPECLGQILSTKYNFIAYPVGIIIALLLLIFFYYMPMDIKSL